MYIYTGRVLNIVPNTSRVLACNQCSNFVAEWVNKYIVFNSFHDNFIANIFCCFSTFSRSFYVLNRTVGGGGLNF